MKVAVFVPNWVGDAVMATPAMRALREHFQHAEFVAVLRPYVAEVLDGLNLVDRLLVHEPRAAHRGNRGWPFVRRLRRERFDLAVLFPNSHRSGWLAWCSGAGRRVGFGRSGRGLLLTDALRPKPRSVPHPVIDEYLRLAAHLGCTRLSRTMELSVRHDDQRQLDSFWERTDPRLPGRGVICLNPGGAFGSAKHWPATSFALLARRIAGELDKAVLILCGPAERSEARDIARQAADPRVMTLADLPLSLGLTKAAVRSAQLLVTTDSGPRHFAAPFGVAVVTLFGPTHMDWSETFHRQAVHLQKRVDCGPCQQRTCPLAHHRCMRELSVDEVFDAVVALLERTGNSTPIAA